MSEDFEALFQKVRPIVYKFRRHYHHIQLWDRHDWEQEGMITLFQLVSSCPEVLENEAKLIVYFKTKFSNHLKDTLRKQLSQKRQFHQMAYEEIGEVGHSVAQGGLVLDEYVAYQEALAAYREGLSAEKSDQLNALIAGECFKGRAAMLRELEAVFQDFRE